MAQGSRSYGRSGSSRSGGRSGGGRSGGGSGGNPAAAVIAIVAIVAVIGVVVLVTRKGKGGDGPPAPPPAGTPDVGAGPAKPKEPEMGPRPVLPSALVLKAQGLVPGFKEANAKYKTLHEQAMEAKKAGDDDAWQEKMAEAREVLKSARDQWVEVEEEVVAILDRTPSKGWNPDLVMDSYFKNESRQVQELLDKPLSGLGKTGRTK